MKLNQYTWDPEKDLIAEGSFAEVFKALDTNTQGRVVALKIYKEAVAKGTQGSSNQKKYSLEEEFRKIDGLSHTNIITYYGQSYMEHKDAMGRSSSYPVIVMEYAEYGTLSDFLKTKPNAGIIDKLIKEIINGVAYLHSEGILHRDLKPGNILITSNRRGEPVAKITDFGISRDLLNRAETLDKSMTAGVGTPHYMAPEQFFKRNFGFNQEISERTDIWAIGVIVYRLFSKRLPFGNGVQDYEQVRDEITNTNPDLTTFPAGAKALVMHCLQKHADKRPESADQLMALFQGGELNEEIEADWNEAEEEPQTMPNPTAQQAEVSDLSTIPKYEPEPETIVINDPPTEIQAMVEETEEPKGAPLALRFTMLILGLTVVTYFSLRFLVLL